jgi:hypothetical protein
VDVWHSWDVEYRDVIVLDRDNQLAGVYNLTNHDLTIPAHRQELLELLLEVAQ